MKMEFDPEKLAKDPDLDNELMMEWLDTICEDTYFEKIGKGEYKLKENEEPIGALVVLISRFRKQSWLLQNLKTWKTFDDEEGESDTLKAVLED